MNRSTSSAKSKTSGHGHHHHRFVKIAKGVWASGQQWYTVEAARDIAGGWNGLLWGCPMGEHRTKVKGNG